MTKKKVNYFFHSITGELKSAPFKRWINLKKYWMMKHQRYFLIYASIPRTIVLWNYRRIKSDEGFLIKS